jgi:hypothetical protein
MDDLADSRPQEHAGWFASAATASATGVTSSTVVAGWAESGGHPAPGAAEVANEATTTAAMVMADAMRAVTRALVETALEPISSVVLVRLLVMTP